MWCSVVSWVPELPPLNYYPLRFPLNLANLRLVKASKGGAEGVV